MTRLYLRTTRIFAIRLVRGLGYRGKAPGLAGLGLLALAILADLLFAAWLHGQAGSFAHRYPGASGLLGATAVLAMFFLTGPVLMFIDAIRDRGSRLQNVLHTLPLTKREVTVVASLPGLAAFGVLSALEVVPAARVLTGLGFTAPMALAAALAASVTGSAMSGLVVAVVRVALRADLWSSARYPAALFAWLGIAVVQSWRSGLSVRSASPGVLDRLLIIPWIAHDAAARHSVDARALAMSGVAAAVATAAYLASARARAQLKVRSVRWRWTGRWPAPLETAELTRVLRSGEVLANAAAGLVVSAALAAALIRLPASLRPALGAILIPVTVLLNAVVILLVRGQTRTEPPVPLRLGISAQRWTGAAMAASIAVYAVLTAILLAELSMCGVPSRVLFPASLTTGLLAFGLAAAIGWAMPASPDNPLGRVAAAMLLMLADAAVVLGASRLPPSDRSGVEVFAGMVALAAPVLLERRRWRTGPTRHRPGQVTARVVAVVTPLRAAVAGWFVVLVAEWVMLARATAAIHSSPATLSTRYRFLGMPVFEAFRHASRIGVHVQVGSLVMLLVPAAAGLGLVAFTVHGAVTADATPSGAREG